MKTLFLHCGFLLVGLVSFAIILVLWPRLTSLVGFRFYQLIYLNPKPANTKSVFLPLISTQLPKDSLQPSCKRLHYTNVKHSLYFNVTAAFQLDRAGKYLIVLTFMENLSVIFNQDWFQLVFKAHYLELWQATIQNNEFQESKRLNV